MKIDGQFSPYIEVNGNVDKAVKTPTVATVDKPAEGVTVPQAAPPGGQLYKSQVPKFSETWELKGRHVGENCVATGGGY